MNPLDLPASHILSRDILSRDGSLQVCSFPGRKADQREGGGWAQNPNLASNAFATGEALWALHDAAGASARRPRVSERRPVPVAHRMAGWLMLRGSHCPKFQPYFQSGFPFDHGQWIS